MNRFGGLLKEWRTYRGMSQMALALAADISQRHLSFVETGRSQPSEDWVVHIARVLGASLRDQNAFLMAAGYAPRFFDGPWQSATLTNLRAAARRMLTHHEPYPGFALNASLTIVDANQAALALLGVAPEAIGSLNLFEVVLAPGPVRQAIENWAEVATYLLSRLREAALYRGPRSELRPFFERALHLARTNNLSAPVPIVTTPLLEVVLRVGEQRTTWFSTVTTFGGPQDAFIEELTIELFYPQEKPDTAS